MAELADALVLGSSGHPVQVQVLSSAELVEHLTFNQVVRGSNPRTLIVEQAVLLVLFFPKLYMRMWRNWQTRWI